jgi:hypothetical protein
MLERADALPNVETHVRYFARHLTGLPSPYQSQDALRMTVLYFALGGLDLLGAFGNPDAAGAVQGCVGFSPMRESRLIFFVLGFFLAYPR